MRCLDARITCKGRVTIPKAIRERLGLKAGDRVKWFVHPDGGVVLLPGVPVSTLRGMVTTQQPAPVTVEEMNDPGTEGGTM